MSGRFDARDLIQLDALPAGFLDAPVAALDALLGGPTLIHLPGRAGRAPLFVSTLLHGNEHTGVLAVQQVLRRYDVGGGATALARPLSLFIGNVAAAAHNRRRLDGQPDFNRVWPGAEGDGPEHRLMTRVVETMAARRPVASLDIHNTTGRNPHYGCVNRVEPGFLHLARLFSRTQVYFTEPRGVQSLAFAPLCPAVTVECGRSGEPAGVARAADWVDAALHLDHLPTTWPAPADVDLFHTVATVKVPAGLSMAIGPGEADLALPLTLETWNFADLDAGTAIARQAPRGDGAILLDVIDETGADCTRAYLAADAGGLITLRRPVVPAMLTSDTRIIAQDCLGYFMERYPLPG
ncbi:peptidase M14 [Rhodothalassium salexigens]|uniref:M14 family metallopeptidase n=1 Tax=Rhodothalassium salexigens TaxID=1086 RepID=UPI001912069D|nr:M14 family metallopeptidase [Rhodothalassium salexigens]MBK5910496.1 peptidase M14 [Rhodothalassium salexigens]MBK5921686.1 peptidase M14 [Rhodothalassium salexigens]